SAKNSMNRPRGWPRMVLPASAACGLVDTEGDSRRTDRDPRSGRKGRNLARAGRQWKVMAGCRPAGHAPGPVQEKEGIQADPAPICRYFTRNFSQHRPMPAQVPGTYPRLAPTPTAVQEPGSGQQRGPAGQPGVYGPGPASAPRADVRAHVEQFGEEGQL